MYLQLRKSQRIILFDIENLVFLLLLEGSIENHIQLIQLSRIHVTSDRYDQMVWNSDCFRDLWFALMQIVIVLPGLYFLLLPHRILVHRYIDHPGNNSGEC